MPNERRTDPALRELVILGNHLCMWAGHSPDSMNQATEIAELLNAWDETLARLREDRKEIEHISL